MSIVNLVLQSGTVARSVLLILLFFSLASWTIIFLKLRAYRKAEAESARFLTAFRGARVSLNDPMNWGLKYEESRHFLRSPLAAMFREGYRELSFLLKAYPPSPSDPTNRGLKGNPSPQVGVGSKVEVAEALEGLNRTLRYASLREIAYLERYLIFLATTGSVTPFIGLFGTVWGIMDAFAGIGSAGSASLGAVAPGIAEALVTTAAGLAAAIPAVIAYNAFLNRVKAFATKMDLFALEFLGLAERVLVKGR